MASMNVYPFVEVDLKGSFLIEIFNSVIAIGHNYSYAACGGKANSYSHGFIAPTKL